MPKRLIHIAAIVALTGTAHGQYWPPPRVTSDKWTQWYDAWLAMRLAECPLARQQTVYFSQAGSDQTGDGSILHPWQTLARARAVLGAGTENIALLFRRGDVWRDAAGLDATANNVTIGDYGTGDKPLFTAFEPIGSPELWSRVTGLQNTFVRPMADTVVWAKEDDNLDDPYARMSSVAHVESTPGSFWYDAGTQQLYIHPKHGGGPFATDPRTDGKAYELVHPRGSGVIIRGDGSRVQNIRAEGWGMTTGQINQQHGIESRAVGTARVVFVGCESHYGMTHLMTHWVLNGGIATFVDCRAGLATFVTDGGSVFNTYSEYGGHQTIWDHCTATHGALPSDNHDTTYRTGEGFYGHTGSLPGAVATLVISNGCTIRDTRYGCSAASAITNLPPAATLDDVRCFFVGETVEGGDGAGRGFQIGLTDVARMNCRYLNMRPHMLGGPLAGWEAGGWVINSTVQIDASDATGTVALFWASWPRHNRVQFWNCDLRIATAPGTTFRFDYATPSVSDGSSLVDSILANTGSGALDPNFTVPVIAGRRGPGPYQNNAYLNAAPAASNWDPARVMLPQPPAGVPSCGSPLTCGAGPLPGGVVLSIDQSGASGLRRTIGPLEAGPCGNCDGSTTPPVLNIADFQCFLNKFAAGDSYANCDGSTAPPVLNVADFQCFLNAMARGCP